MIFEVYPTSDRGVNLWCFPLTEGWLLSLIVNPEDGNIKSGEVWFRILTTRGYPPFMLAGEALVAGYATRRALLCWPGSGNQSSTEGNGNLREIVGTDPSAGAEINEAVPTGALWRPLAMRFTLVTNATAGNREVHLLIDDGTNAHYNLSAGTNQVASTTWTYTIGAHAQSGLKGTDTVAIPIPPGILLEAGHRLRTSTTGLLAGDDYSAPNMLVEEWLSP
jgi:hypothetical protein